MRLMHISDLHFGPTYRPEIGEKILSNLIRLNIRVLAISGDFTQRARVSQFKAAQDFLAKARAIAPHVALCPGNHDIALYRFWERFLYPFRKYRHYIHPELDTVLRTADGCIVGLNSVRPYRYLVEGRLDATQYNRAKQVFAEAPSQNFRIVMCHHPPGSEKRPVSPSFSRFCAEAQVDVVLSGHAHQSSAVAMLAEPRTILVSCGTSTSGRGRGDEMGANTFVLLEGDDAVLKVATYRYDPTQQDFSLNREVTFPRGSGWVRSRET